MLGDGAQQADRRLGFHFCIDNFANHQIIINFNPDGYGDCVANGTFPGIAMWFFGKVGKCLSFGRSVSQEKNHKGDAYCAYEEFFCILSVVHGAVFFAFPELGCGVIRLPLVSFHSNEGTFTATQR